MVFHLLKQWKKAGFNFRDESKGPRKDLKAFVEVHVEQGSVLETEKISCGVVNNIVGQRRYTVEIMVKLIMQVQRQWVIEKMLFLQQAT